jgi:hyaluronate lyase
VNPTNDTFVRQNGTYATANCNIGTAPGNCGATVSNSVEVKKDTTNGNSRVSYFIFDITNIATNLTSVKVRLYGHATTSAKNYGVYSVSSTTWSETTMTWNTMPAIGATALSIVNVGTADAYREWDVTAYVQAQKTGGQTKVSFAVQLEANSADGPAVFYSKESATNKPELVAQ